MTSNRRMPLVKISCRSLSTVTATGSGLSLVTTSDAWTESFIIEPFRGSGYHTVGPKNSLMEKHCYYGADERRREIYPPVRVFACDDLRSEASSRIDASTADGTADENGGR